MMAFAAMGEPIPDILACLKEEFQAFASDTHCMEQVHRQNCLSGDYTSMVCAESLLYSR